ncbi:phosphoenolpyruvate carboxylase, partial [Citrobacter sp. AAK_AS5]
SHGHDAIRHYIISHTETVSDMLEVLLLQKEVGVILGTMVGETTAGAAPSTETIAAVEAEVQGMSRSAGAQLESAQGVHGMGASVHA